MGEHGKEEIYNKSSRTSSASSNSLHRNNETESSAMKEKTVMFNTSKPFTVSVEGNIGSGKSTLLNYFAKFPNVSISMEPVDQWRNVRNHNLLELMYKDLQRWNFMFQSYVQLSRVKIQTSPTNNKIHMFERSLQNNRFCFVEMAHDSGLLSDPEYIVLDEWYQWIQKNMDIHIDLIVYLRSSPDVVHKRIQMRNRSEERTIPLEYLRQLHEAYEKWLFHSDNVPAPVLTLDVDGDISQVEQLYTENEKYILGQCSL